MHPRNVQDLVDVVLASFDDVAPHKLNDKFRGIKKVFERAMFAKAESSFARSHLFKENRRRNEENLEVILCDADIYNSSNAFLQKYFHVNVKYVTWYDYLSISLNLKLKVEK